MLEKLKFDVIPLSEVPSHPTLIPRESPLILIVDDERVIADTLSVILSRSGFRTVAAYDGTRAAEIAADIKPDLLISDVVMPEMSGIDLAIHVKETIPTCKILLFSGQAATMDLLQEARRNGHNFTTLAKPVHPTDLLRRINESLTAPSTIDEPTAFETLP